MLCIPAEDLHHKVSCQNGYQESLRRWDFGASWIVLRSENACVARDDTVETELCGECDEMRVEGEFLNTKFMKEYL